MPYLVNNGGFKSVLGVLVRRGQAIKLTKKQASEFGPLVEGGVFTSESRKPKGLVIVEPFKEAPGSVAAKPTNRASKKVKKESD